MNNIIRNRSLSDIVETGSNANGTYVKYRNGIMECYGTITPATNNNSGNLYTFPAPFLDIPIVIAQARAISSGGVASSNVTEHNATTTTTVLVKVLGHGVTTIVNVVNEIIEVRAIGKWTSVYDASKPTISIGRGIIESASNANGSYIKYEDGTMTCFKRITLNISISTTSNSSFVSPDTSLGDWSQVFSSVPSISATLTDAVQPACWVARVGFGATTSSAGSVTLMSSASRTTYNNIIDIVATGRWQSATNMVGAYTYGQGIVETGSNTNGNWIKFDNGVMIQHGTIASAAYTITTVSGGLFRTASTIVFPLATSFLNTDFIFTSNCVINGGGLYLGCEYAISVNSITSYIMNASSYTGSFPIKYQAIGKWK